MSNRVRAPWLTRKPVSSGPKRTRYPAIRLWRTEIEQGVQSQDQTDPMTWQNDNLMTAMFQELRALDCTERGLIAEANEYARLARSMFCRGLGVNGVPDSVYRRALYDRAKETLGEETAELLGVKRHPRRKVAG